MGPMLGMRIYMMGWLGGWVVRFSIALYGSGARVDVVGT